MTPPPTPGPSPTVCDPKGNDCAHTTPIPTVPPLVTNPQFAKAAIYYGQGLTAQLANGAGRFQKVALKPGENIDVVLTFTALDFGQPADVQVLDGGSIGAPTISSLGALYH